MEWNLRRRLTAWLALAVGVTFAFVTLSVRVTGQEASSGQPVQVTFTKDIAPILQQHCQSCHRPGSVARMSLLTYEEVRPWARAIKYRTGLGTGMDVMPPWFIDKTVGIQQFKDDMSLTDEEIAKIATWVDNGAPRGNLADMLPPLEFAPAGRMADWRAGFDRLLS